GSPAASTIVSGLAAHHSWRSAAAAARAVATSCGCKPELHTTRIWPWTVSNASPAVSIIEPQKYPAIRSYDLALSSRSRRNDLCSFWRRDEKRRIIAVPYVCLPHPAAQ